MKKYFRVSYKYKGATESVMIGYFGNLTTKAAERIIKKDLDGRRKMEILSIEEDFHS